MKTKDEIIDRLKYLIEEITIGRIQACEILITHRILGDLGLDSIDYAGVLLGCEEWMNIEIREDGISWNEIQTIGELSDFLIKEQRL